MLLMLLLYGHITIQRLAFWQNIGRFMKFLLCLVQNMNLQTLEINTVMATGLISNVVNDN